jgi:hypothetical protein
MRFAVVVGFLAACRSHGGGGDVPGDIDDWARKILAMPAEQVCTSDTPLRDAYFCMVKPALFTDAVRALDCTYVTLQNLHSQEHYLNFDWGGGHIEAHGILIGPEDWTPDPQMYRHKLRDGVFTYDQREE